MKNSNKKLLSLIVLMLSVILFISILSLDMNIKPYKLSEKEHNILDMIEYEKYPIIYNYNLSKQISLITVEFLELDKNGKWIAKKTLQKSNNGFSVNNKILIDYSREYGDFIISFKDKNGISSFEGKLDNTFLLKDDLDKRIIQNKKIKILKNKQIPLCLFYEAGNGDILTDIDLFYDTTVLKSFNNVQCIAISYK